MNKKLIIVTFGELSTKGKNIMTFIRLLGKNIKRVISPFPNVEVNIQRDHIYIYFDEKYLDNIRSNLKKVPGILSFYLAHPCKKELNDIYKTSLSIFKESSKSTFKIQTKRIDKSFILTSDELNKEIGAYILKNSKGKVDVHNPEILIKVVIREDSAYVYGLKENGLGGYPLGIAGKSLHLLSGGIDSPVAAFLMMKRGVELEMIHFEASPYTSEKVIDKIYDLIHVLNIYQENIKLHIVPFAKLEKEIYDIAGPSYCVTIMRRMMLRISNIIAKKNNCLVISSGESIGQVASQTLPSINVIEEVSLFPVIRPLACSDKIDIISLAKQIDTYNISIRPYEDCCTIFQLKDPTTHPSKETVLKIENKIKYEELIEECISNTKTIVINNNEDEI